MRKEYFIEKLEGFCPLELQEDWDNCGFQVDTGKENCERVLVALEVTNEVIDEAIELGADFIVTHHPMLFSPIRKVKADDVIGSYICKLIKNDISVYACHTNFDKLDGGNNDYIGALLELEDIRPFDQDNGFCRKGNTPFEVTFLEVVHKAAEAFDIEERFFKTVGDLSKTIETIGWCSGAGTEFLTAAKQEGCDLYITGDLKYHEAQMAKELGICVLDAGHYGSEKIFVENMADMLRLEVRMGNVEILESAIDINPFK